MSITKGMTCLACPGGPWAEVTITRCNEDGTYNAMPVGSTSFLDKWECITRPEISVDDAAGWPAVFERLRGTRAGIGRDEVRRALESLGFTVGTEELSEFWATRVKALFDLDDADALELDEAQAYRLFVGSGYSAKMLARTATERANELFRLYWNGIRMGGRDPADVDQPIGIAETLAALKLTDALEDPPAFAALFAFEQQHGITLPETLRTLWTKDGVLGAISSSHCNSPEPAPIGDWAVLRDLTGTITAKVAVRIMLPHQGDHAWWAVFESGAPDAGVAVSFEEDGPPVRMVATTLPFLFWDLAVTGQCWERANAEEEVEE